MGTQGYRANYREAFECASDQLQDIYSEYRYLQYRKEQLEGAVAALGPFLNMARIPTREEVRLPEPMHMESAWEQELVPQGILNTLAASEPATPVTAPEPVVAPSYAPVSEANVDPIQARINRALGLAVA
jgi:hypothetical protein